MKWTIAAFYHFTPLDDFREKQVQLLQFCEWQEIRGVVLLAAEGINGTIAGSQTAIEAFFQEIRKDLRLQTIQYKCSYATQAPFRKIRVRCKKEIVTMGVPNVDPNQEVGTYVTPQQWNALISNPDVLVIDTRNSYEYEVGTFQRAQDPQTESFCAFPDYVEEQLEGQKQKKIAMFCTGGIRCEKATSMMRAQGFEHVYHLQGGILKYLEEIPPEQSLWEGECFVFDERVTVDHRLQPGHYDLCRGCGHPISAQDKSSEDYVEGITCPKCAHTMTPERYQRFLNKCRHHGIPLPSEKTNNRFLHPTS
ncbi:MAG: rhodanese-related sulfurtransferase [Myxococcota bacterium]